MPKALGFSYTQEGSGKDVVLLHGWGASKDSFYYVTQHLEKRFRVTAIDFPGFGASDKPAHPYTVFDYASSLNALLTYLDLRPYAVVAHSFGARVAIKLLSSESELTEKLVITGGAGIKPKRTFRGMLKKTTYRFLRKTHLFSAETLRKKFGSKDYACLDEVMRKTFVNVVCEDLTPKLKEIVCPTLLIWGENDRETPLYMGKIMNREIAQSALITMEDAGHFCFIDSPYVFNKILDKFL